MSGVAPDPPNNFDPKHEAPLKSPWVPAPDPLDRIQTRASGASSELYADVLALVEVARAARPFAEPHDTTFAQYEALRAALARLDKQAQP